ncbi:MAG: RidA family protein [Burkholderiales bacterium]|nr:RidA family protein [Burkholderiales bacterium]
MSTMEAPVGAQAIAIYRQYRSLFRREGATFAHLLRYHVYQRDKRFFPVFDRVRRHHETAPPSSTAVGLGRFEPTGRARLCIDAVGLRPAAERTLGRREVLTGAASYAAPATFSHVIGAGHYLFVAGQIPIDTAQPGAPLIRNYEDIPEAGRFLRVGRSHEDTRNGPIAAQTWFTYDVIRRHLEAIGSSLASILNLVVYLQDIRDFPTFHRVHERFFGSDPPALTVIEANEVGHKGTLIEIEPTAILPGRSAKRRIFNPRDWHAPAHMSALVEAGGLAFLSGLLGVGDSGAPVDSLKALPAAVRARVARDLARDTVALQCAAILHALKRLLQDAGHGLDRVAHLTVYLRDIERVTSVERLLAGAFGRWRPAMTILEVPHPAPVPGVEVSISATAWFGEEKPVAC